MLLAQKSSMATTVATTKSAATSMEQSTKPKKFGKMLCHSKSMPVATIKNESTEMLLRMFEHLVSGPNASNSCDSQLNNDSK